MHVLFCIFLSPYIDCIYSPSLIIALMWVCLKQDRKDVRTSRLFINPFLFLSGLSCPHYIQVSLSLNCLKLTTPMDFSKTSFLYPAVTLALKRKA